MRQLVGQMTIGRRESEVAPECTGIERYCCIRARTDQDSRLRLKSSFLVAHARNHAGVVCVACLDSSLQTCSYNISERVEVAASYSPCLLFVHGSYAHMCNDESIPEYRGRDNCNKKISHQAKPQRKESIPYFPMEILSPAL